MKFGTFEHRKKFIEDKKEECYANIYLNEINLLKLDDELGLLRKELAKINLEIDNKGKPPANEQKKKLFTLEENIKMKEREIAKTEENKRYNEYILNDLLPRYEEANKPE